MIGLYPGYFNLVLILAGALSYLALAKMSDSAVLNRTISIDETVANTLKASENEVSTPVCDQMLARIYEDAVLHGGFRVPRTFTHKGFALLNKIVFPNQLFCDEPYTDRDAIRANIALPNLYITQRCNAAFDSYGVQNSKLSLLHELGYMRYVI